MLASVSVFLALGLGLGLGASANAAMSKQQLLGGMLASDKQKIVPGYLQRLSDSEKNEFIVEFTSEYSGDASEAAVLPEQLSALQSRLRSHKNSVFASLGVNDLAVVKDFGSLPFSFVRTNSRESFAKLIGNPRVRAIHENIKHYANLQQSLPLIGEPAALAAGYAGAGATVAVLDTGVRYETSYFGSCIAPGLPVGTCKVVAALDTAPDDGAHDADGHGTNVAGIIRGVAPGANIAAVDVFNGDSASAADIIAGIDWVIANKAKYNIVALNLSLSAADKWPGECPSSWATTAFANARAAGVVPVVAAGNNAYTDGLPQPACTPGAVRVGAVYDANLGPLAWSICTDSSTAADKVACFSNSSNYLTILAPGSIITSAGMSMSGTSQAAPHVAGAIAVMRAPNALPKENIDNIIGRLVASGRPITDSRNGYTFPRLDLGRATAAIAAGTSSDVLLIHAIIWDTLTGY